MRKDIIISIVISLCIILIFFWYILGKVASIM